MAVWAPLLAALFAAPSCWGATAGAFAVERAAHDAGGTRSKLDPAIVNVASRGGPTDEVRVGKPGRQDASPGSARAEEIRVSTTRAADGKTIKVAVALVLPIDQAVVREVLGDFENMPRFVPDILAARPSDAGPGRTRVEIEASARLLFLEFPIETTLDVVYPPDGSITIDSVAGNLAIHGVVQVRGDGPTTRVDYRARMTPDFWLPQLIGDFLIGRLIRRQFGGMVAEMYRRADKLADAP